LLIDEKCYFKTNNVPMMAHNGKNTSKRKPFHDDHYEPEQKNYDDLNQQPFSPDKVKLFERYL